MRAGLAVVSWAALAIGLALALILGKPLGYVVVLTSLVGFLVHRNLLRAHLRRYRRHTQIETFR